MVVSVNPEPHKSEFNALLNLTIEQLNEHAKESPNTIKLLQGSKLEPYTCELLSHLAKGTPFENTIELVGGQKFPDIVANRFYGIEVKTTKQNHWKTTGNSVLESSRIADVERIYMLFGKLGEPIEFRFRPYEDCLSEVVVTHSPRYLIDMNLEKGKTIFDKINTSYDKLRLKENPIKSITDYYKSKLKPGQDLWWIQDTENASNLVVNIWNNLSRRERDEIKFRSMVYFPEIFSTNTDKFARLAIWLVTRESVVCPNIRDHFTAGGQEEYLLNGTVNKNMPRVFINLFNNLNSILDIIKSTSPEVLSEFWGVTTNEENKIYLWVDLVSTNGKMAWGKRSHDLKNTLIGLIQERDAKNK